MDKFKVGDIIRDKELRNGEVQRAKIYKVTECYYWLDWISQHRDNRKMYTKSAMDDEDFWGVILDQEYMDKLKLEQEMKEVFNG